MYAPVSLYNNRKILNVNLSAGITFGTLQGGLDWYQVRFYNFISSGTCTPQSVAKVMNAVECFTRKLQFASVLYEWLRIPILEYCRL